MNNGKMSCTFDPLEIYLNLGLMGSPSCLLYSFRSLSTRELSAPLLCRKKGSCDFGGVEGERGNTQ